MKGIILLIFTLLLFGCSNISIYDEVANEMVMTQTQALDYSLSWHRINPTGLDNSTDFTEVLASCTKQLEGERQDFMRKNNPTKTVATIQLHKCLNDIGWGVDVQQTIILH